MVDVIWCLTQKRAWDAVVVPRARSLWSIRKGGIMHPTFACFTPALCRSECTRGSPWSCQNRPLSTMHDFEDRKRRASSACTTPTPAGSSPTWRRLGAGEARWQDGTPGLLRHRRGGGAARRAVAGGAGEAAQRSAVAPLASEQEVQGAATATRSSRRKVWSRPRRPMRTSRRRRWPRPYVPSGAFFKEENAPPMPPDAVVKREREAVVRGGEALG